MSFALQNSRQFRQLLNLQIREFLELKGKEKMKRVREIEQFYDKKYSKEDLVNAINCIDRLYPRFEGFLQEDLTIRECILTYLSYCAAAEKFSYAWKGFGAKIDAEGTIRLANSFIKSKTISKKQAEMAIRVFFSKRQKAAMEQ